ncbi:bacteriophage abortive infection AbiH family protein [Priestia aryabhattai]|uniref:bacteriophage abortive infection AbiH family protein n=1 Tax=Priestia aryabhattai TaxID=412384 RepID=UPI003D2AA4FD
MSNLFIIGNGFDLAHGLPTSYEHFHQYLVNNYPGSLEKEPSFNIEGTTTPNGGIKFDDDELVAFIIGVISAAEEDGENWCDIERNLGLLDFSMYFSDMSYLYGHEQDDNAFSRRVHRYEDVSGNFHLAMLEVKSLFSRWVASIDTSKVSDKIAFHNLIHPEEDTFLTFNYTNVLEEVYGAIDVNHIHGAQREKIVIGHGETYRDSSEQYTGSEYSLMKLHDALRKNTEEIIEKENCFFSNLQDIDKIYSHGFSFSKVDLPYIKEICNRLDTKNIIWYLNDYDSKEKICNYINTIMDCGFKGRFSIFGLDQK